MSITWSLYAMLIVDDKKYSIMYECLFAYLFLSISGLAKGFYQISSKN